MTRKNVCEWVCVYDMRMGCYILYYAFVGGKVVLAYDNRVSLLESKASEDGE